MPQPLSFLSSQQPALALAPMQDITDLDFWRILSRRGGPDVYFTEYLRVTETSRVGGEVIRSLEENPTGRPSVVQIIGNHVPAMQRAARDLQKYSVAAIDLNLGCPAPVVYRKCAGGGLLRDLKRVDALLAGLREVIAIPFTVKTRLGFDSKTQFPELLELIARHQVDLLTVHGRTVSGGYRSAVDYEAIALAATSLPCPVLANGNIYSPGKARQVLTETQAAGLMIGRAAIRNPWIFEQIRTEQQGRPLVYPTGNQVLEYIHELYETTCSPMVKEISQVQRMKKYMNFLALGVEDSGRFLHDIRRATSRSTFFEICHSFLEHNTPMPLEPFELSLKATDVLSGIHH